jgi:hypothetical protein
MMYVNVKRMTIISHRTRRTSAGKRRWRRATATTRWRRHRRRGRRRWKVLGGAGHTGNFTNPYLLKPTVPASTWPA